MKHQRLFITLLFPLFFSSSLAVAEDFAQWKAQFSERARDEGISRSVIENAFEGMEEPIEKYNFLVKILLTPHEI